MTISLINSSYREPDVAEAPVNVSYTAVDNEIPVQNQLAKIVYRPVSAITDAPAHPSVQKAQIQGPSVDVALPCLSTPCQEVWYTPDPVSGGCDGAVTYSRTSQVIFGVVRARESEYASLEECTSKVYTEILQFLQQMSYSSLLRVWNYFSDINVDNDGIERYKRFCVGRHRAVSVVPDFERYLPAASAIGTAEQDFFLVYFIAAKKPGVQIENPRQISAFHYPDQYGPKSPSFTRAMLKNWKEVSQLYISGTASIVGHKTLHRDDVFLQLDETVENLRSLIGHVRAAHQCGIERLDQISALKVYIRHPEHYPLIEERLRELTAGKVPVLYLQGDICRKDLLLEIEGLASFRR